MSLLLARCVLLLPPVLLLGQLGFIPPRTPAFTLLLIEEEGDTDARDNPRPCARELVPAPNHHCGSLSWRVHAEPLGLMLKKAEAPQGFTGTAGEFPWVLGASPASPGVVQPCHTWE